MKPCRYDEPVWKIERRLADIAGESMTLQDTVVSCTLRLRELKQERAELLIQLRDAKQGVTS